MPESQVPTIYLTFDDGPHPVATRFVLEQLDTYNAKATFFCIGKNVAEHPELFAQTIAAGHAIGNHTYNHLNGWETPAQAYTDNVAKAGKLIESSAFRPPYGRITRRQSAILQRQAPRYTIYMWSVLSADFDEKLSPEKCLDNVLSNLHPGAIVVFHDSQKAWERMRYALPFVLDYCREHGWALEALRA